MRKLLCLILLVGMVLGCGSDIHDLKITEENKDTFLNEIKDSKGLSVEEMQLLAGYMMRYAFVDGTSKLFGDDEAAKALSPVGKTIGDLIDAQRTWVKNEKEASNKEEAAEAARMAQNKKLNEQDRGALRDFVVTRSELSWQDGILGLETILNVSVKNNTKHAISRAYFKGSYITPGRSVPWHEGDFNYEIPGGLEPGESAEWSLKPNIMSDWGKVTKQEGAVLKVEVYRLDGVGGKILYSTRR